MCTAITFSKKDFYFGRTLDLEETHGEEVVISPRNYPLLFLQMPDLKCHHAIIGMAHVADGYPLYYDAMNETGVCMAGLNFPGFAQYSKIVDGMDNVACFEFIPWVLGQCRNLEDVRKLLAQLCLIETPFSPELPTTQLHWIISDKTKSLTIESVKSGFKIYENPVGVLTNNPTFDYHLMNINNYMSLSEGVSENEFSNVSVPFREALWYFPCIA